MNRTYSVQEDLGGDGESPRGGTRRDCRGGGLAHRHPADLGPQVTEVESVAVVPTGSFCRTSSSFRDLPSEESWARAQGLLELAHPATLEPGGSPTRRLYSLGSSGGTGGRGTTVGL